MTTNLNNLPSASKLATGLVPAVALPNPTRTSTQPRARSQTWRRWLPLALVLAVSLFMRLPLMADPAYPGDLRHTAFWLRDMERYGFLEFYRADLRYGAWDRLYPPLSTYSFGAMLLYFGAAPDPRAALDIPDFVILHKLLPVLCEIALIAAVGIWLVDRRRLRWIIPGLLALTPGILAVSAWWGQYEATFTLFLVLSLIAANRDRPLVAWIMFGLAVLLKQPALALGPLLLAITWRRYGWRRSLVGMVAAGGLCALAIAPFALGSGLKDALSPYLNASDAFPFLTNNAYNSWYGLASLHKGGGLVLFQEGQFRDSGFTLAGIPAKLIGLSLLGGFALLIAAASWRQGRNEGEGRFERREFVWAAALYFGFFMLPTQVHERYLYPAAVFAIIAIAQEKRLAWVAVPLLATFSYNILAILIPAHWRGATLYPEIWALPVSLANVALFAATCALTLLPHGWPSVVLAWADGRAWVGARLHASPDPPSARRATGQG